MNFFFLIINTFFCVYAWKAAGRDFEEGNNFSGWTYIFLSALNGAAVASLLTR